MNPWGIFLMYFAVVLGTFLAGFFCGYVSRRGQPRDYNNNHYIDDKGREYTIIDRQVAGPKRRAF